MVKMERAYLAHEYLDEHWELFQFSEVAQRLSDAKLNFVASATLTESRQQAARRVCARHSHAHRDRAPPPALAAELRPRGRIQVRRAVGPARRHGRVHCGSLAEKHASFDELVALPAFGEANAGKLLDCLALLVTGCILKQLHAKSVILRNENTICT
jgi:hypothetical protein